MKEEIVACPRVGDGKEFARLLRIGVAKVTESSQLGEMRELMKHVPFCKSCRTEWDENYPVEKNEV